ncbi:MAG: cell wall-binding repeat-containing protein [Coriobacteriia bacterium]
MSHAHAHRGVLARLTIVLTLLFTLAVAAPAYAATLAEGLDTTAIVTTGGNAGWFGVDSVSAHDGIDFAQSGAITHSQNSYFEITVTGPRQLAWWDNVSSELNWDFLRVYIDGVQQWQKSGDRGWESSFVMVPKGEHTIRWAYVKDSSVNSYLDRVLVDYMTIVNTPPTGRTDGAYLQLSEQVLQPAARETDDWFGVSIATAGDVMAVGASRDDVATVTDVGSVIMLRRASGTWAEDQTLVAADSAAGDYFGSAVAMDGGYLAVTSPIAEQIYTYADDGVSFLAMGAPIVSPGGPGIGFGHSVAISGDVMVAGARAYNGWRGGAYVFRYNGVGWAQEALLTAPDAAVNDQFGISVAIDGNRIIVGAQDHNHAGYPGGAAYIYDYNAGTWGFTKELNVAGVVGDDFGCAVGVSGDTAVVGCSGTKRVHVYSLDTAWRMTDILTAPTAQTLTNFGLHVAIDGDTIVAGDGFYDGATKGGAVFAYARSNGIFFDLVETLQPTVGESFPQFGDAVDIDGAVIAVGARNWDGDVGSTQGRAFAYGGSYNHMMDGDTITRLGPWGVLGNDVDPEGDPLEVASFVQPDSGTLTMYTNGDFSYVADVGSPAEVGCQYRPEDPWELGAWTDVYFTIAAPPAGTAVFNGGETYVSEPSVGVATSFTGARLYRTRSDSGTWSEWSWISSTTHTISLGAVSDGPHTVDLEVSGPGGQKTFSDSVVLDTGDPTVSRDPFTTLHAGDSITLRATDSTSGVKRIVFSGEGGTPSGSGATLSVTFPTAGAFDIQYYSEDNAGNVSGTVTEEITVLPINATTAYSRFAGADRFATAILASQNAYATGSCSSVIIATGMNYPDALSAAGLGGAAGAPVLLVNGDVLSTSVKNEIKRLTSGKTTFKVYIMGGTMAVTSKMETSIKAGLTGESVERFAGANRYATAQMVAAKIKALRGADFGTRALLIPSMDYADGLIVGPAAYAQKVPILLVNTTADATLVNSLKTLGVTDLVICGTTTRIPVAVETYLKAGVPGLTTRRVSGNADTYVRSAEAAEWFCTPVNGFGLTWNGVGIATGERYPDGLAAGCIDGKAGNPLLLTKVATLPASVSARLAAHKDLITTVRYYGGTAAISTAVDTAVKAAID